MELEIDEIGPSLKNASAKVTRAQRGQQGGQQRGGYQQPAQGGWGQQQDDPWATPQQAPTQPPF